MSRPAPKSAAAARARRPGLGQRHDRRRLSRAATCCAASIRSLDPAERAPLVARFQLPEPRTGLGPRLAGVAHAMCDVSDGLIADLGHICEASGVAAVVELAAVPLSAPASRSRGAGAGSARAARDGGRRLRAAVCRAARGNRRDRAPRRRAEPADHPDRQRRAGVGRAPASARTAGRSRSRPPATGISEVG